jgi:hypothetical protein
MKTLLRMFVCPALAGVWACTSDEPRSSRATGGPATWAAMPDTGLELRVILGRDTISAEDRAPVPIFYSVANGSTESVFYPDRFEFSVMKSDGSPLEPFSANPPPLTTQPQTKMDLPPYILVGQVQDLRCIVEGRDVSDRRSRPLCIARYDLRAPGIYRVIVDYNGRDDYGDLDSLIAAAESGKVHYPIQPRARGLRLADTATLVVTPQ